VAVAALFHSQSDAMRAVAYRKAIRHSRFVRSLRVTLPLLAILAFGLAVGYVYLDPFRPPPVEVNIEKLNLDGSKITMDHANLRGFKDGDDPFVITADRAIQDISTPYIVDLEGLKSDLTFPDQGPVKISADQGVYDSQKDSLSVRGHVLIDASRFSIVMRSGAIDFKTNRLQTKEPVTVHMAGGAIDADAMSVFDNGSRVQFDGHVRSVFRRAAGESTSAPAGVQQ